MQVWKAGNTSVKGAVTSRHNDIITTNSNTKPHHSQGSRSPGTKLGSKCLPLEQPLNPDLTNRLCQTWYHQKPTILEPENIQEKVRETVPNRNTEELNANWSDETSAAGEEEGERAETTIADPPRGTTPGGGKPGGYNEGKAAETTAGIRWSWETLKETSRIEIKKDHLSEEVIRLTTKSSKTSRVRSFKTCE